MVAGKVKAAMGFQRSPATPKTEAPSRSKRRCSGSPGSGHKAAPTSGISSNSKSGCNNNAGEVGVFPRSFGMYFPRSITPAQVQPRPPDVAELLRVVEELQERESLLRTELLEYKILKETVQIVPFLEAQIVSKDDELEQLKQSIALLEAEYRVVKSKAQREEEERVRQEEKVKELEAEVEQLRRTLAGQQRESEECSSSSQRFQGLIDASARSTLLRSVRRVPKTSDIVVSNELHKAGEQLINREECVSIRAPRIPKPPPTPCSSSSPNSSCCSTSSNSPFESSTATKTSIPELSGSPLIPPAPPPQPAGLPASTIGASVPPPPPPPPPPSRGMRSGAASVRRVPEVVEFYHSLMRRDSKRETAGVPTDAAVPAAANARNMIGEIENRSAHLLAIKTEVETQGDFIRFLIKEVQSAAFTNIEDVVAFVKWLDDELSFLVDERAVLKHFEWPEQKADAMREAAFGYCDLKKLETEASSFIDDHRQPCSSALKKMQSLLDKLEQKVYNLSRARECASAKFRGFKIPCDWMLESGALITKIKLASVKLAMKYMKRVSSELESIADGPEEEELMLQGVRFAFRVHQFAGGFDVETMRAFQELKDKAQSFRVQSQHPGNSHQQQLKVYNKSATC